MDVDVSCRWESNRIIGIVHASMPSWKHTKELYSRPLAETSHVRQPTSGKGQLHFHIDWLRMRFGSYCFLLYGHAEMDALDTASRGDEGRGSTRDGDFTSVP